MSEEKSDTEKKDVVEATKYNEAIEAANSEKIKKEKLENELKEMKETKEEEKKDEEKVETEKKEWETEKVEMEKKMEDLKKQAEEKNQTKVPKGKVHEETTPEDNLENSKKMLDEQFPNREKNPESWGSPIHRWGYYKNPTTNQSNTQKLGELMRLQAEFPVSRESESPFARGEAKETHNLIINKSR